MDRLVWLQQIVEKQPEDAQAWYWLGSEQIAQGRAVEAMSSFSSGLRHVTDANVREQLLQGIAEATALLSALPKPASNPQPANVQDATFDRPDGSTDEGTDPSETGSSLTGSGASPVSKFKAIPGFKVIDGGLAAESQPESVAPNKIPSVTFSDVAGLTELKKTIQVKIISPFFNQGLFAKFRKKAGGGVLLYGPPGCGKTFMARATAGECKAKFIPVHITDILDPYIGSSEQNLRDLFEKARYQKPSIMFFDELDAIGFSRSKSSSNMRGLIDTFLTEMEGIDTDTDQVLILGATNTPWDVDNALKRPGRFDRLIFVAPPDVEARKNLFAMQLQDRYVEANIDVLRLAKQTELFSGADVVHVCELAAEQVLMEIMDGGAERRINQADLETAIASVQPSTLEWLRTAKNYVKYANQSGLYNDVEKFLKEHGKRI